MRLSLIGGMILLMVYLLLFAIGAAMGSFIGASTWRLYKLNQATSKKSKEKYSITHGRSMCEHCHHQLSPKDLIPIYSWLSLGGKCRYCKKKISSELLYVEIVTGLLFMLSFGVWTFSTQYDYLGFVVWLVFLTTLLIIALYDLKWLIIPNKLIYPLIYATIVYVLVSAVFLGGGYELVRSSVLGLLFAGGSFYLLFTVSKGSWIGGGDVKLGVFLGLYLGLTNSLLAFFLAFNLAALVVLPLMLAKKIDRKTKIPFGPFLIGAIIICALYGQRIIEWYNQTFLYGLL